MNSANIIRLSTLTSSVSVSSGSGGLSTRISVFNTSTEEVFTIAVPAAAAMTCSNRDGSSRRLSNRTGRSGWVGGRRSLPVNGIAATPGPPDIPKVDFPDPRDPANAASLADLPKSRPSAEKVELTIDSLQNYELVKSIPVMVESLGDKIFMAEAPDLNLSITGNSLGGALLLLKDHITTVYEGYRIKKTLDPERARQLKMLETYIGKTRRNWF